jgi:hypothetical protein
MKKTLFFKLSIIVALAILTLAGCKKTTPIVVTPTTPPSMFNTLVINGNIKVHLEQGLSNSVDTTIAGVIVKFNINKTAFISGAGEITVYVNDVDTIIANGSTQLLTSSTLNLPHLILAANGLSSINVSMNVSDSLVVSALGAGPYTFKGTTPRLHLITAGLSYIKAFDLITSDCNLAINGANKAEVYATNSLRVFIAGLGAVYYKGNPLTISPTILGIGQLIKK